MANETYVQVAVDGAGKLVDAIGITHPTSGATQYRQAVVVGDPNFANNLHQIGMDGGALVRSYAIEDLLLQLLVEMKIHTQILHATLGSRDDVDALRAEFGAGTNQLTQ